MQSRFIELKLTNGENLILNIAYICQISPTHGEDFVNGVDVVFLALGEQGVLMAPVPASHVAELLQLVSESGSRFLDIKPIDGQRVILNKDYITHITPTHGNNLANGADVSVWGSMVQVPASSVAEILKLLQTTS